MKAEHAFTIEPHNLIIDCKDARAMGEFYSALLGVEPGEKYGFPTVSVPGLPVMIFVAEEDFVPPVWPEEPGKQQKELHLDFTVSNLSAAVAFAEAHGAKKAPAQFGDGHWVTLLDPAGHPFCLVPAK